MLTTLSETTVYLCPSIVITVAVVILIRRMRQPYRQWQEIEERQFVILQEAVEPPSMRAAQYIQDLRDAGFQLVGAYREKYPTAEPYATSPVFLLFGPQGTTSAIVYAQGQATIGGLYSFYPNDHTVVNTFFSLPLFRLIITGNRPDSPTSYIRGVKLALEQHDMITRQHERQHGKPMRLTRIEDYTAILNEMNASVTGTAMRDTLVRVYLVMGIAATFMVVVILHYLTRFTTGLPPLGVAGAVWSLLAALAAAGFFGWHYRAVR